MQNIIQEFRLLKVSRLIAISSIGLVSGCSWFSGSGLFDDKTYDYTDAKMSTELVVPDNVGVDNSQDLYLVPQLMPGVEGEIYGVDNDVLAPMQVLSLGGDVRANKKANLSSAFISKPEIEVWDFVERYTEKDNVPLASKNIGNAELTTDWITNTKESFWWGDDKPVDRHKFKIKVLEAERKTETRIDVEVLAAEIYVDDQWQSYIDSNRAGASFLNEILGFMYVENLRASRARVTQSALGGISVSMGTDLKGNPALVTSSGFEQTWNRVPIAMKLVKVRVEDKDRSQGLYFVTRRNEDDSFFDSLAFWSDNEDNALMVKQGFYRIQITEENNKTYILFTDSDDVPLEAEVLAKNFPLLSKAFKARVRDLSEEQGR